MKFACDVMLGGLAKWLRASGFDVFYDAHIDRSRLFRVAREEGRVILTRTHSYDELKDIPAYQVIESENVAEQVRQFYGNHPELDPWKDFLSRCVECNAILETVEKAEVEEQLPPKVKEGMHEFRRCPNCKRVYWPGTHVSRMKSFLKQAVSN